MARLTSTDIYGSLYVQGSQVTGSLTTTGKFIAPLGTVSLPSYTFLNDLDTGIWSPGADIFAISTAGAERFRIASDGIVTIATNAITLNATNTYIYAGGISNRTSINNSRVDLDNAGIIIQRNIADANTALIINQVHASSTGDILKVQAAGTDRLTVKRDGKVGIGNAAPAGRLVVQDSTASNTETVLIVNNAGTSSSGWIADFQYGGSTRVTIDNNGDIRSATGLLNRNNINNSAVKTLTTGTEISRNISDTNPTLIVNQVHASSTGDILKVQATGTDRLTVKQDGKVGIGTSSPAAKLVIHDSGSANTYLQITNNATGTNLTDGLNILQSGLNSIFINRENGYMSFETNNTEKMRIASNGYVGIGTSSPAAELDVKGNVVIRHGGTNFTTISNNEINHYTYTETPTLLYIQNSTDVSAVTNIGRNALYIVGNNGNVGIGTTSPGAKLDIDGNIRYTNHADRTFTIASTSSGTAGRALSVQSGSTASGGTDIAGGNLNIRSGQSTGTASSSIVFQTPLPAGSSGTGLNSLTDRLIINHTGVSVGGSLTVGEDLIVNGTVNTIYAQDVYTENDHIFLRDGAISGLSIGAFAGIIAKLADGTNDAGLVFDGNGVARVGDITYNSGTPVYTATQALATREDIPTNNAFPFWNNSTYRFETDSEITRYSSGQITANTFRAVNGLCNSDTSNNSYVNTSATGTIVSRNITGSGTALIVNQIHASATGDILKVQAAGTDRLTVKQDGKVGIGTNTPSAKLTINGSSNTGELLVSTSSTLSSISTATLLAPSSPTSGTSDVYFSVGKSLTNNNATLIGHSITNGGGNPYAFMTIYGRPASDFVVSSTGNVGIGITNPQTPLHILGSTTVASAGLSSLSSAPTNMLNLLVGTNTNGNANGIKFYENTGGFGMSFGYDGSGSSGDNRLSIYSDTATTLFSFMNDGRLGIGTTAPNELLEVVGNIHLSGADRTIYNRSNHFLAFGTNNAERIRILSGGNVGVNKSTPGAQLEVLSSATNKVGFILDTPASPSVNISEWKINGTNKVLINSSGELASAVMHATNLYSYSGTSNAAITLGTTGTIISRLINDANTALTVNQAGSSSTGEIQVWQHNSVAKASLSPGGRLYLYSLANFTSAHNAMIDMPSTGTVISRNQGDSNSALTINQIHPSSSGKALDIQAAGTTNAYIEKTGLAFFNSDVYTTGILNKATGNNSTIYLYDTGTVISRNMAGSGTALIVNQIHASSTGDILKVQAGGTDRLTVKQDGKVGIGTDTPSKELHLLGRLRIEHSADNVVDFMRTGANTFTIEHDTSKLYFYNSTTSKAILTMLNNGKIGIGTTSAASVLQINGTSDDSWNSNIGLSKDGVELGKIIVDSEGMKFRTEVASDNFYFRNSANTTSLFIEDSGRVGIGTTSPSTHLHVYKDSLADVGTILLDQPTAPTGSTSTGPHFYMKSGGSNRGWIGFFDNTNHGSGTALNLKSAGDVRIGAGGIGGAGQLFINASTGRVGIGTTSPVGTLDVQTLSGTTTLRVHSNHDSSPIASIELLRGTNSTFGLDSLNDWRIRNDGGVFYIDRGFNNTTITPLILDGTGMTVLGDISLTNASSISTSTGALTLNTGNASDIILQTNGATKWSIKSDGILESTGAQTLRTSTGSLTLASSGGNGNISLEPNGNGFVTHTKGLASKGANYTSTWMKFTEHQYGNALYLGSGGLTAIGGGESIDAIIGNIPVDNESLILASDNSTTETAFRFISSLQAGWSTRVEALTITGAGNATLAGSLTLTGTLATSTGNLTLNTGTAADIALQTNGTTRWWIRSGGILESNTAQTLRTSTGSLTLATGGADGSILLSPHGTGKVRLTTLATAGFVKTNATGELSIDTSTYLTAESDTLATVTTRGSTTTNQVTTSAYNMGTSSSTTTQATMRYDSTSKSIKFVFA